jgi:hypothetical protein
LQALRLLQRWHRFGNPGQSETAIQRMSMIAVTSLSRSVCERSQIAFNAAMQRTSIRRKGFTRAMLTKSFTVFEQSARGMGTPGWSLWQDPALARPGGKIGDDQVRSSLTHALDPRFFSERRKTFGGLKMPRPLHAPTDEMSAKFFEDTLEALGCPPWYRNPLVSNAIDKAWDDGFRSVGEVAQEVLKSNPLVRRLVRD